MTMHAAVIASILSADDTTGGMRESSKLMQRWKYNHRFESNDSKFHLVVTKPRGTAGGVKPHKQHDTEAAIILPGRHLATQSEPKTVLLGGQVTAKCDDLTLWSYYVRKVARHQLDIARILHQAGSASALEFARAVVEVPLMTAAAVDTDFTGRAAMMDRLQRALWCGVPRRPRA